MQKSALLSVLCFFFAVALSLPIGLQAPPQIPIRIRSGSNSFQLLTPRSKGFDPIGGNFTPVPPPIQCDDFSNNNGIACVYVVSVAKMLITPLVIGNVTMPAKNPKFVVDPPKEITTGGWFSFHTLLDWSNKTAPVDPWSGVVQCGARLPSPSLRSEKL
jgi:hypothetical protein